MSQSEPEWARESQREPDSEPERARVSQREPESAMEYDSVLSRNVKIRHFFVAKR